MRLAPVHPERPTTPTSPSPSRARPAVGPTATSRTRLASRTKLSSRSHSAAFTLVELLVVIGIIAILLSLLLPSLSRARQRAYDVQCQANLRTIGTALTAYANDHRDRFPDGVTVGNAEYRVMPGRQDIPTNPPERFGLPAVLHGLTRGDSITALDNRPRYLDARSAIWTCPAAGEQFRAYGNTYAWLAMATKINGQNDPNARGNWTSRQRGRTVRYDGEPSPPSYTAFLRDEFYNKPFPSGLFANAWVPGGGTLTQQQYQYPHRYGGPSTRVDTVVGANSTITKRSGAYQVLFFDGSVGLIIQRPSAKGTATIKG